MIRVMLTEGGEDHMSWHLLARHWGVRCGGRQEGTIIWNESQQPWDGGQRSGGYLHGRGKSRFGGQNVLAKWELSKAGLLELWTPAGSHMGRWVFSVLVTTCWWDSEDFSGCRVLEQAVDRGLELSAMLFPILSSDIDWVEDREEENKKGRLLDDRKKGF